MRLILFLAALLAATPAAAHLSIAPKESSVGAHERYAIRIPNEKKVDTIAIEVRFPSSLRVTALQQMSGWMTEPLRNPASALIGARWTGRLPPEEFVEFGVLATNPTTGSDLTWTAVQRFADGSSIEWSGPPGSKTPAAHVKLNKGSEMPMAAH